MRRFVLFLLAFAAPVAVPRGATAQISYTSTAGTGFWSSSRWNNSADASPYNTTFTVNNNASFTTTTGNTFTFTGAVNSGTLNVGDVTVAAGVTVSFSAASGTYGTNGAVRTLNIGTGSTLDFGSNQSFSTASGTGFTKSGEGVLSMSGSAYNGGFTLNAGTVVLRGVNTMGGGANNTLTLAGGALVANASRDMTGKYAGGISVTGNVTLGTTASAVGGVTTSATANLTFSDAMNFQGGTRTLTVGGNGTYTLGGNISNGGLSVGLASGATGNLTLTGSNIYAGGTAVSDARLILGAVAALPTSGNVSVSGAGRLTLNTAGTYGGSGQTLTLTPTQVANPAVDTLSGAAVVFSGGLAVNADSRIDVNGSSGSLTINGSLSGSGLLSKQATGNLILSGASSLTGGTQVGGGTLTVNSGSALGTGALTLFQTGTNNTTVTLNNATQTVGSLSSRFAATSGTQSQTLNLNGTALTVNQTGATTFGLGAVSTLTSTIAGTGSVALSNTSTGTLTVTAANTYSGGTTVGGGTLLANGQTGTSSATGSGAVAVNSGGTLGGTGQVGNNTTGPVSVNSGGMLQPGDATATGTLTILGNLTVSSGGQVNIKAATTTTTANGLFVNGSLSFSNSGGKVQFDANSVSFDPSTTYTLPFGLAGTSTAGLNVTDQSLFSTLNFANASSFTLSLTGDNSGAINLVLTPVPEPATVLVVAAGGLGLLRLRRRFI